MEASVQYNDFKGTAAADISDGYISFDDYLSKKFKKYDKSRYSCKGLDIFFSYDDLINVEFICNDKKLQKDVVLSPSKDMTISEVLKLFKRFDIIIGDSNINAISQDLDCEEPIYLD